MSEEADRLLELLSEEKLSPDVLESGLGKFSAASRNEVVARVARTLDPPPPGRVLARLLFIRTPENEQDMALAFIANLRSPFPDARKFSLYGLEKLAHPVAVDFGLASLRDEDDQVVTAAATMLLPKAEQDPRVASLLRQFYQLHEGDERFYMSLQLIKSRLIDPVSPA